MTLITSVTPKGRVPMNAESLVSVVGTADGEGLREVVADEREIIESAPRRLQVIPLQPVTETSYVPPGIANIPCTASLLFQSKHLSLTLQTLFYLHPL